MKEFNLIDKMDVKSRKNFYQNGKSLLLKNVQNLNLIQNENIYNQRMNRKNVA